MPQTKSSEDLLQMWQDNCSVDMTFSLLKFLSHACCLEKFIPISIDLTERKNDGQYKV